MPTVRTLDRSFSSGEITPEMFGRMDLAKFQSGLATCRNFIAQPHGPARNRTGTQFVKEVSNSAVPTRLIGFNYTNTQTFAIEIGAGYFRWHTQGATLLYTPTPWNPQAIYNIGDLVTYGGSTYYCTTTGTQYAVPSTLAGWRALTWSGASSYVPGDIVTYSGAYYYCVQATSVSATWNIAYAQNNGSGLVQIAIPWSVSPFPSTIHVGDAITVAGVLGTTEANGTWTVAAVSTNSPPPGHPATTYVDLAGSTYTHAYVSGGTVSEGSTPGTANSIWYPMPADGTYQIPNPYAAADLFSIHYVQSADVLTLVHPNYPPVELRRYGATNWVLSTINFQPTITAPTSVTATPTGSGGTPVTLQYVVSSVSSTSNLEQSLPSTSIGSCSLDLTVAGNYVTITWTAVTGAQRYNIYKYSNGLYGYIGQAAGTSFQDKNITADISQTPPSLDTTFSGGAGYYPQAVGYFEQRRGFAGWTASPQSLLTSRSGTESNICYHIPSVADDRLALRIAAREASAIRHIVPLQDVILLTATNEFRMYASDGNAIQANNVTVKPQAYVGANNVQPCVVANTVLYAASRGGHVREMAYNWQAQSYLTGDISLMAAHLFDYHQIVDMAFAKAPTPILWAVNEAGTLLGLTYVPEQQISAWHHHDTTNGLFESCCTVTENNEDMLYVIVNRTINGVTRRYVERLASRNFATQADSFYVDCGATYNGAPTMTVTGLTWLAGQTVNVLGDGAVMPQCVVSNDGTGTITLQTAASKIQVGLPITADLLTLPFVYAATDYGQGRPKNINKAYLRVYNSSGVFAGPDFNNLVQYAQRTVEPYGAPPALVSNEIEIVLDNSWGNSGQLAVRQSDPLPLIVVSLALDVAVGG